MTAPAAHLLPRPQPYERWVPSWQPVFSRRVVLVAFVIAVVSLVALLIDAKEIQGGASRIFDRHYELTVHHDLSPALKPFMVLVSTVAGPWGVTFIVLAVALALFALRSAWAGVLIVVGPGGSSLIETALKHTFHRQRPHLWPHALVVHSYSFPSGHATGAMAFWAVVTYLAWRKAGFGTGIMVLMLGVAVTLLVGLSRVYLGVHWPTDIIGGYSVGLFWTAFLIVVLERLSITRAGEGDQNSAT